MKSEAIGTNKEFGDVWMDQVNIYREEARKEFAKTLDAQISHLRSLLIKKNNDYAAAYKKRGLYGILVRIEDKLTRIENLFDKDPECEAMLDSWYDVAGYAMLAVMLLKDGNSDAPGSIICQETPREGCGV